MVRRITPFSAVNAAVLTVIEGQRRVMLDISPLTVNGFGVYWQHLECSEASNASLITPSSMVIDRFKDDLDIDVS